MYSPDSKRRVGRSIEAAGRNTAGLQPPASAAEDPRSEEEAWRAEAPGHREAGGPSGPRSWREADTPHPGGCGQGRLQLDDTIAPSSSGTY